MSRWQDYKEEAINFAAPYVRQAGEHAENAAEKIGKSYRKNRRKIKREFRLLRIKRILEIASSIVMIAAAVVALLLLAANWLKEKN
ncbi:hypothetical protein [Ructibacterium gallinarum]|uniref:Uncharacterized protein n=1 Tax=Ructibacterium gallinarum TaxID=2779355 RepID=A0A9D5M3Z5_9FIRM|nr:hypothetical protein [Ructibacterium gallinarum]MBE5040274.1 hypothetical protein [Ructibacterium gallinarum]